MQSATPSPARLVHDGHVLVAVNGDHLLVGLLRALAILAWGGGAGEGGQIVRESAWSQKGWVLGYSARTQSMRVCAAAALPPCQRPSTTHAPV